METRHPQLKSSPLPQDFLRLVSEVFGNNFDTGLKEIGKIKKGPRFEAGGAIFPAEVVLSISLIFEDQLAATTVFASCDFDPKASAPTVQDLLNACVDGIASVFGELLDPKKPAKIEQLADDSLSALQNVPFDWTTVDVDKYKVYLKIDKSNPQLDQMADDWLAKNDPDHKKRAKQEQEDTEKLFVTGPKHAKSGSGSQGSGSSGNIH